MKYPKVHRAEVIGDRTLRTIFASQDVRDYDISLLLEKPMFTPLQQPAFFKRFNLEPGDYDIVWNEDIDISEHELWKNSTVPAKEDKLQGVITMTTSIAELMPAIATLSHSDKLRLVQLVLAQLAQDDGQAQQLTQPFDPRSFFGVTHQPRQAIDDYLESIREGWL